VKFRAINDTAEEGTRYAFINHTTSNSTDRGYAAAKLLSVKVQINDDDRAGVIITPSGLGNAVLEGGFTDTFQMMLGRQPTANVAVTLTPFNNQVLLTSADARYNAATRTVTFSSTNYATPVTFTITALDDAVVEGFHTETISYTVASAD